MRAVARPQERRASRHPQPSPTASVSGAGWHGASTLKNPSAFHIMGLNALIAAAQAQQQGSTGKIVAGGGGAYSLQDQAQATGRDIKAAGSPAHAYGGSHAGLIRAVSPAGEGLPDGPCDHKAVGDAATAFSSQRRASVTYSTFARVVKMSDGTVIDGWSRPVR